MKYKWQSFISRLSHLTFWQWHGTWHSLGSKLTSAWIRCPSSQIQATYQWLWLHTKMALPHRFFQNGRFSSINDQRITNNLVESNSFDQTIWSSFLLRTMQNHAARCIWLQYISTAFVPSPPSHGMPWEALRASFNSSLRPECDGLCPGIRVY